MIAMENSDFDANLAAAAGDDAQLRAELIASFRQSVAQNVDLLRRARCDGNWEVAAMRLIGLGSSFHAPELVRLAKVAQSSAPGDPVILRQLSHYSESLADKV